jgi:porin
MKHLTFVAVFVLALTAAAFGQSTATDSENLDWKNRNHASGDWGGLRQRLSNQGIEPFWEWTGIGSGNPTGGVRRGFTVVDDSFFGVNLDLGKMSGWHGAKLTISGVNRDGRGLTNHYIMSQYNVQQSVGGQNIFFYQLCLQQKLWNDKVSLKVGRFSASDDLNASPIYGYYINNGINGDIRNVLFDTQSSAYPFATWAGLVRVAPNKRFNAQFGVYQTWAGIFDNNGNGINWRIRSDDGVILMTQFAWTPEFSRTRAPGNATASGNADSSAGKDRPGHYWVGATYSPWKGFSQFGRPGKVADSYGFYVHGDQMVYQKKPGTDQGLTVWAASGFYPQANISIVPYQVNVGLFYKGLFAKRDDDRTIFGVIYGRFSRDYAHTIEATGQGFPTYETVIEGGHRFQLTKFAFLQPDIQWVLKPAGTGRIPNAIAIGAEMGVKF